MKKILSILILSLFLASIIPAVFAEDNAFGRQERVKELRQLNHNKRDIKEGYELHEKDRDQLRDNFKSCKIKNNGTDCDDLKNKLKDEKQKGVDAQGPLRRTDAG